MPESSPVKHDEFFQRLLAAGSHSALARRERSLSIACEFFAESAKNSQAIPQRQPGCSGSGT